MSGETTGPELTPEEVASMWPYERQQGGWWEYGPQCDVYGNGKVWRPMPQAAS